MHLPAKANSLSVQTFMAIKTHSDSNAGTYFTHEAKGADDAADADTAIINAEGGHNNTDEKKEYYI